MIAVREMLLEQWAIWILVGVSTAKCVSPLVAR